MVRQRLRGHHAEALWELGQHLAGTGCTSQGAHPAQEPGPFLGTRGWFLLPNLWGCGPFSPVSTDT